VAHNVEIESGSKLAEILRRDTASAHVATAPSAHVATAPSAHVATGASAVQRSEASANSSRPSSHRGPAQSPPPEANRKTQDRGNLLLPVNSSHHQSADAIGNGLRIAARCPDDAIIEAVEGIAPDHFVLAVQWHPERSVDDDEPSRAIFRGLINAANARHKHSAGELENVK
jgi:putative glutamine amidotransferase